MVSGQGFKEVEQAAPDLQKSELLGKAELLGVLEEVISLKSRVDHLREWQQRQNGSLLRLERRVEQIYLWLIGLMGGVVSSLVLLVVNIALRE